MRGRGAPPTLRTIFFLVFFFEALTKLVKTRIVSSVTTSLLRYLLLVGFQRSKELSASLNSLSHLSACYNSELSPLAVMEPNSSAPPVNLSGSELVQDVSDWRLFPTPLILILALASLSGGVAVQVYRKHRHVLEPLHIFELNTLVNISVVLLIRAIKPLVIFQLTIPLICSIIQWLTFYCRINIYTGIIMSQVDRFLALHLHTQYKARVTPELAWVREGSEKYYQSINNKWLREQFDQTI